ncbi:hypothetical protein Tco_0658499 [Tanacetum coccineum]
MTHRVDLWGRIVKGCFINFFLFRNPFAMEEMKRVFSVIIIPQYNHMRSYQIVVRDESVYSEFRLMVAWSVKNGMILFFEETRNNRDQDHKGKAAQPVDDVVEAVSTQTEREVETIGNQIDEENQEKALNTLEKDKVADSREHDLDETCLESSSRIK